MVPTTTAPRGRYVTSPARSPWSWRHCGSTSTTWPRAWSHPVQPAAIDDPELLDTQVQSIPFKRAAQPAEIARLAVFLASSDSDYVTGSSYYMDGGLMRNLGQGA